jgi:hypothetical protein
MAKYELRDKRTNGWVESDAVESLRNLLQEYPDTIVKLGETEWRLKPKDEELIDQIMDIILYDNISFDHRSTAERIYELLEEKGLI